MKNTITSLTATLTRDEYAKLLDCTLDLRSVDWFSTGTSDQVRLTPELEQDMWTTDVYTLHGWCAPLERIPEDIDEIEIIYFF